MNQWPTISAFLFLGLVLVTFVSFPTRIKNEVEINGPPNRVFDIVTTADRPA